MSETETERIDRTVIFACGDRSFTVRDLIDGALFRGELEPTWSELLRLIAAEAKADEQDLEYDDDAIDAAASSTSITRSRNVRRLSGPTSPESESLS